MQMKVDKFRYKFLQMNADYCKFLQLDEYVCKKARNQVKGCSPPHGLDWDKATHISNKLYSLAYLTFSFKGMISVKILHV